MKKNMFLVLGTLIIFLGVFFLSTKLFSDSNENVEFDNGMEDHIFANNHMVVDAKMDEFSTLSDVEKKSDIIVVATKTNQNEPSIQRNENGDLILIYTLSEVKVDNVISGNVEEGTLITVFENAGYDEAADRNYHIAGYELMETNRPYLLFLRKSETSDYYIPSGISYGKVPINKEDSSLQKSILESDTEYSKDLLSEYQAISEIHKQALSKYSDHLGEK